MEVGHPGVETQEFLSAFPPLEPLLSPYSSVFLSWAERHPRRERTPLRTPLLPHGACPLLNDVVRPGRGDYLLVVDVSQARNLSDCGSVAAQPVGMDDGWDIKFPQQSGQECSGRLRTPTRLRQHNPLAACSPKRAFPFPFGLLSDQIAETVRSRGPLTSEGWCWPTPQASQEHHVHSSALHKSTLASPNSPFLTACRTAPRSRRLPPQLQR